jgi:hypothetical protein
MALAVRGCVYYPMDIRVFMYEFVDQRNAQHTLTKLSLIRSDSIFQSCLRSREQGGIQEFASIANTCSIHPALPHRC